MAPKERITTLPDVTVATISTAIDSYVRQAKSRNLYAQLRPFFSLKWKGAPQPGPMATVAPLFLLLFTEGRACNGMLPNRNLNKALQQLRESLCLELPANVEALWADRLNQCIRGLATHWRALKESSLQKERCFKKASPQEIRAMETVLNVIIPDEKKNQGEKILADNFVPQPHGLQEMGCKDRWGVKFLMDLLCLCPNALMRKVPRKVVVHGNFDPMPKSPDEKIFKKDGTFVLSDVNYLPMPKDIDGKGSMVDGKLVPSSAKDENEFKQVGGDMIAGNSVPTEEGLAGKFGPIEEEIAGNFVPMQEDLAGNFVPIKNDLAGNFVPMKKDLAGNFVPMQKDLDGNFVPVQKDLDGNFVPVQKDLAGNFVPMASPKKVEQKVIDGNFVPIVMAEATKKSSEESPDFKKLLALVEGCPKSM